MHCEIDEGRRTHCDQHVGAQAGTAQPVLPLGADHGAEHERPAEADQRVEKIGRLEGFEKAHVALIKRER
jgi:hypothetical protein